ncbi:MAG: hypothetical protein LBG76_11370 [Treponema sp.]|jgi:tetratricopeptide (TPR) repeat protein|nr:hypothetical protein [Treponema sp.]
MKRNRWFRIAALLIGGTAAGALEAQTLSRDPLPDWFIPLREAVYEQRLTADEVSPLYREVKDTAQARLSGAALNLMLSRCEYMMGRVYQDNNLKDEALACFEKGIEWAEKSLAIQANSGAYEILAANIGQACMLKPVPWVMANGLRVEQNAKKALTLNPHNAAASYLIASRWVFGPGLLGNPKRGITEMEAILNSSGELQKDEFFNVYSAIGYGYIQLKKYQDALPWVQRSLAIYPSNKYAGDLLSQIQQAGR